MSCYCIPSLSKSVVHEAAPIHKRVLNYFLKADQSGQMYEKIHLQLFVWYGTPYGKLQPSLMAQCHFL